MAESPGPTRKPYFPGSSDLAGYNRHLTESLGRLTDPSEFDAFTLFPEGDGKPPRESPSFVWQDFSSLTTPPPPPQCISPPGVEFSPRGAPTFLPPSYEDYLKGSAQEFSPPVSPLSSELSPPVRPLSPSYTAHNGFSPRHYTEEKDFTHVSELADSSQQGYDIYSMPIEDWNNFSPYSPFGTLENVGYSQVSDKDSANKPSYSEVIRSSRAKLSQSGKADADCGKRKPDFIIKPPRQVKKSFSKHYHSKGKTGRPEAPSLPVHPDSKYGLDQFEDPTVMRKNSSSCSGSLHEKTSSAESLIQLTRQESTSSVSSGASAGDDLKSHTGSTGSPVMTSKMTSQEHPSSPLSTTENSVQDSKNKGGKSCQTTSPARTTNVSCSAEGSVKGPATPFFDPKRIFQSRPSSGSKKSSSGLNSSQVGGSTTVLNNGKLSYAPKSSTNVNKRTSDYINNDLRDTRKSSNSGCSAKKEHESSVGKSIKDEPSCHGKHFNKYDKSKGVYSRQSGKLKSHNANSDGPASSSSSPSGQPAGHRASTQDSPSRGHNIDQELIDEWLTYGQEKARWLCHQSWSFLVTIVVLLITLVAFVLSVLVAKLVNWTRELVQRKLFGLEGSKSGDSRQKLGLEENITLPTTGDEAMQRLLACKGKDPYSILGLHYEATEDEIKKYYKRQAVLVHPDKNQQPGAEEAFKILGHAFELIGEPDKRRQYNSQVHEAHDAETAMQEFADLLTKLQEKIQEVSSSIVLPPNLSLSFSYITDRDQCKELVMAERLRVVHLLFHCCQKLLIMAAANMMRCDNCGGKHRRLPVDRAWYSARFCDRCCQSHSAKEGDIWAETSMLGFKWHYYACMEGKVFDITEWVACRREFFKHMQANAHHVFYRIATEGNWGHQHGRTGENNLEEFINHLVHRAMGSEGGENSPWGQQKHGGSGQTGWNSKDGNARRKRKKKKH